MRPTCRACGAPAWGECPEHKRERSSRWNSLGVALGMVSCIGAFIFGLEWALTALADEFGRETAIVIAIGAMLTAVFYTMARHDGAEG